MACPHRETSNSLWSLESFLPLFRQLSVAGGVSGNKDSLTVLSNAVTEQWVAKEPKQSYQFLRQGYFALDPDSTDEKLVFNRVVSLKDTWAKIQKKN